MIGSEIFQNATWDPKEDLKKKDNMILNLDFGLPCRTSPVHCSRGSPCGWGWIFFFEKKKSYRKFSYKKIHKRQNYCKGRYAMAHISDYCKNLKLKSKDDNHFLKLLE